MKKLLEYLTEKMSKEDRTSMGKTIEVDSDLQEDWNKVRSFYEDDRAWVVGLDDPEFKQKAVEVQKSSTKLMLEIYNRGYA